jgi:hypothetical protein
MFDIGIKVNFMDNFCFKDLELLISYSFKSLILTKAQNILHKMNFPNTFSFQSEKRHHD